MIASIRDRRAHLRGFTMIELLAVIAFIGFVVAAAAPSWVEVTRDRRVDNAALNIADVFRTARARAMGRHSATMVRWDAGIAIPTPALPQGHFTVREGVLGASGLPGAANNLPTSSCFTPDWSDAGLTSKYVMAFDERAKRFAPATVKFLDDTGNAQAFAQVCFTPGGRTYIRYAAAGAFAVMNGVVRAQVINSTTNLSRFVVIPPHGSARVVAEL